MLALKPFPDRFLPPKLNNTDTEAQLVSPLFKGRIDTRWRLTSYSCLLASLDVGSTHDAVDVSLPPQERPDYDEATASDSATQSGLSEPPVLDALVFQGSSSRNLSPCHLEKISFTDPTGHEAVIGAEPARAGFDQSWLPVVGSWMGIFSNQLG